MSVEYNGLVSAGKFSLSSDYETMHKKIVSSEQYVSQTTSECQHYNLKISGFEGHTPQAIFIRALEEAVSSDSWDAFIEEFGTHYVKEVTMGGRATQDISYSKEAISRLKSLNVSISTAA